MKKIISFLMAVILVIAMGSSVCWAEETNTGKIIIEKTIEGTVYSAYKLLDLTVHTLDEAHAYTYKPATNWVDFFNQADVTKYFRSEKNSSVTPTNLFKEDSQGFIKLVKAFIDENGIKPEGTGETKKGKKTAEINGLELGYYFVDTTMGSMCILQSVSKSVTIAEKNEIPSIDKDVKDGDNWKKLNDVTIGEKVDFRTTVKVVYGATNYKVIDNLSKGLTYIENSIIVMNGEENITNSCKSKFDENTNSFTLTIPDEILPEVKKGESKDIIITYSAILNDNAIVDGPNDNETQLLYGNGSKTEFVKTETYTYQFDIFKYGIVDTVETPLKGAQFMLSKDNKGKDIINFSIVNNGTYKVTTSTDQNTHAILTSGDDGYIHLQGLDAGTYYLTETKAPDGYNLLTDPVTITISSDAEVSSFCVGDNNSDKEPETPINAIKILNKGGEKLPATGGIGTTIFYVLGGLLMIGAVVILVTKKKMSMMEE